MHRKVVGVILGTKKLLRLESGSNCGPEQIKQKFYNIGSKDILSVSAHRSCIFSIVFFHCPTTSLPGHHHVIADVPL